MYSLDMFVTPIISSIVAAIAIMISSEIIEHNLEAKHAIILALAANLASTFATPILSPMLSAFIPPISLISGITLPSLIVDLAFWIILSFVIMTNSFTDEKIKIAIFGFAITTVVMIAFPYVLPYVMPMFGNTTLAAK
jgi:hypothetical protein